MILDTETSDVRFAHAQGRRLELLHIWVTVGPISYFFPRCIVTSVATGVVGSHGSRIRRTNGKRKYHTSLRKLWSVFFEMCKEVVLEDEDGRQPLR